jgi:cytidyltransferase-like protein
MRIGLTTGVYDLLHEGHRRFFERAREHCDYLVVAVASDWLTRVQKGPTRPIEREEFRCAQVAALPDVGRAYVTDDLDFSRFAPFVDVVLLGEDQANVRCGSIPWVRVPRTPGVSTTAILLNHATQENPKE